MAGSVLGIDFGSTRVTTVSANPTDPPAIVVGSSLVAITPSVVHFARDGRTLTGDEAIDAARAEPESAVVGVRDRIGNPAWAHVVDGVEFNAADAATLLFQRVAQDAGIDAASTVAAVMTVPAHFNDVQRIAVIDAARGAGLPVSRLVNQPSAAALAYAVSAGLQGKVLVYNLDDAFDATVVDVVSDTEIHILAADGDPALMGFTPEARNGRVASAVQRALRHARIGPKAIDAVIISGVHASDDPAVSAFTALFGRAVMHDIDPAEVCARGAVVCASMIQPSARAAAA